MSRGRSTSLLMGAVVFSFGNVAFAIDDQSCVEQHARGRELEHAGALIRARDAWKACSNDACPAIVREDCAKLAAEAHARIPTLRFRAVLPDGSDASKVSFSVDAERELRELGSDPVALDPGRHAFRFRAPGMVDVKRELNLVAGERNRVVVIRFQTTSTEPPARKPRAPSREPNQPAAVPVISWVLGGVAVAGMGAGIYFGARGRDKESDLDGCAPRCTKDGYDDMYRNYVFADVSFALAAVAAGAALFFVLDAPSSKPSQSELVLRPSVSGATLSFSPGFWP